MHHMALHGIGIIATTAAQQKSQWNIIHRAQTYECPNIFIRISKRD